MYSGLTHTEENKVTTRTVGGKYSNRRIEKISNGKIIHNFYSSSNAEVIKSRSLKWAGHAECTMMSRAHKIFAGSKRAIILDKYEQTGRVT